MNIVWKQSLPFTFRLRYYFLLPVVCGTGFLVSFFYRTADFVFLPKSRTSASWDRLNDTDNKERYTIKTSGCSIPLLHAFDSNIKKFVEYPIKIKPCDDPTKALLEYNKTHISVKLENLYLYNTTEINLENIDLYNINEVKNVICCYRPFYRPALIEDITSPSVDHRIKYDKCIYFYDTIDVKDEFVRVTCYNNVTRKMYEQFYLTAPKKIFLEHDGKHELPVNKSVYNVIVLGIDSVSRLNLYRTMPKTTTFIKEYGGVDLAGYNKVGDNTFPNVIPLLLGIKDTELKHTCVPYSSASFDNCPFVWEWYKQAGYYTALAEDSSLGTFDFSRTPTDYYIHTFIHEAERNVGCNKDNSFLCMKDIYFYKVLLDYVESLSITLKDNKLFGFFWESTMSHDKLNYPMVMDDSYLDFFKRLKTSNYLNDTILFLLSDHGIRWGGIRSTKQGRLEERLPFMIVMLPHSFREKYSLAYKNLKLNSRHLTTPFDVHETLMDLVNINNVQDDVLAARSCEPYANRRGISLFLPIPSNRTCEMAGIDDHWCTCHKESALPINSSEATEASAYLVRHLNILLSEHPQCARLTLTEVMEITEMEVGRPVKSEVGWREFMVVIQTSPGKGVFEATLRRDKVKWSVVGSVSRLNLYGNQSHCVYDYRLKLFCYCTN